MQYSLLRLLQLVSPTLPVGAFAYSQGLEYAVESGLIKNTNDTRSWITGLMEHNLSNMDLPIALRVYHALIEQDEEKILYWNQSALANRETNELRLETVQLAKALLRLLHDMGEDISVFGQEQCDWSVVFAFAAYSWKISEEDMLSGYLWSWLENQIAAAIKLVPLGQTQGQILIKDIAEHIPELIEKSRQVSDSEIGALAPAMAIMSCKHETQYSRLFRS